MLAVHQHFQFQPFLNLPRLADADAFVLNPLARPCGTGFLVTRYNNDGSYTNSPAVNNGRSYTHGGGSSDTNRDSIKAAAMAFIGETANMLSGNVQAGVLAVVSQHTERVQVEMLVSALTEAPLFTDGFEGN